MNKEIVSLRKVSKWYGGQGGLTKTSIFSEIDFSLKEKEILNEQYNIEHVVGDDDFGDIEAEVDYWLNKFIGIIYNEKN